MTSSGTLAAAGRSFSAIFEFYNNTFFLGNFSPETRTLNMLSTCSARLARVCTKTESQLNPKFELEPKSGTIG